MAKPPEEARDELSPTAGKGGRPPCGHCGTLCPDGLFTLGDTPFCCAGCLGVWQILHENGLAAFYGLAPGAGTRVAAGAAPGRFDYLDDPAVREKLVDFSSETLTRVTFHLPAIHCVACVWLLENLFRLRSGIGESRVNFLRREVSVGFDPRELRLGELAALLTSLGYEPELNLAALERRPGSGGERRLWLQIGLAGFAFGNIMLLSISHYFGLDSGLARSFSLLSGVVSLVLATPVFIYSAMDYWRAAWVSLRRSALSIDVPIALGLAALYAQSAWEILARRGEGYFDSATGLIFLLLCGRLFQQKTYQRLSFDHDYRSFFPLAVARKRGGVEERVSLAQVAPGDRLALRHGELIPADARLVCGRAMVDYSFVTGEAELVELGEGEALHAGGRQMGALIEVEALRRPSESYLTSLWNQPAFRKEKRDSLDSLINRFSRRFTRLVLAVAAAAAAAWWRVDPGMAVKAFVSVLIVACPCALALAAPFGLGTALRLLGRRGVFLKGTDVIEAMAGLDMVVFDKTGTLTTGGAGEARFLGEPLTADEARWVFSLARHSTHPHSVAIHAALAGTAYPEAVRGFVENPGQGIEGSVAGHEIWLGSAAWLAGRGVAMPEGPPPSGPAAQLAIDGRRRGAWALAHELRPNSEALAGALAGGHGLAVLSGDNARDEARLRRLFGEGAELRFHQSPREKLDYIQARQAEGRRVMMVGDGLNDSGALRQSDVGVAVVERAGVFSPASDVIMSAELVPQLHQVVAFARGAARVVKASFVISSAYNAAGVAIAAMGLLSPVVCAVLMPASSVTVVGFACGATAWLARRSGLAERECGDSPEGRP